MWTQACEIMHGYFYHLCKFSLLQAGETIVISSAAGQMGHIVGQIAK